MGSRLAVRRKKSLQRGVYRPRVIGLEERLPLGDAVVGPLVAASWIGAQSTWSWESDSPSVLKDEGIAWASGKSESRESLWGGAVVGSKAVEQITLGSPEQHRPLFSAEDLGDVGTASPVSTVRGAPDFADRMVYAPETLGAVAGTEVNWGSSFYGRHGQGDHVGQLQAVASVRVRGERRVGARSAAPVGKEQIQQNYGKMGLSFEANVGQADSSVQFLAHGPGYGVYLTGTEAVMVLSPPTVGSAWRTGGVIPMSMPDAQGAGATQGADAPRSEGKGSPATVVRMQILGGNPTARVVGEEQLSGKVNYFLGNDPAQWHTNIATYAKVEYEQVYPGIDMVYYGSRGQLEYDFVVAPGADPGVIQLGFAGADGLSVDGKGNLVVNAGGQEIVQHKPVVYQEVNGGRREIGSAFVLGSDCSPLVGQGRAREVEFRLARYDTSRPLVIDPVLSFSTYLGGSVADGGLGIVVDPATGDVLVAGVSYSTNFPTANPLQPIYGGNGDAFVARLSADGSVLIFSTYLGGNSLDQANGIAVDPATGDVLVAGVTRSPNFPTANALQWYNAGGTDAFVARLSADGSVLVFSTYLGGNRDDQANGIAIDPATGDVLVTGFTYSPNFPTANPLQPNNAGSPDAFVARLNADGSALVYSTYLGGSGDDLGNAIAVDPTTGDVLITGYTSSRDFPTANPLQPNYGGGVYDAFVARLSADGSALVFSTYLGGSGLDQGFGITVEPATGDVLVTGYTSSTNFPTANPLQPNLGGGAGNAFVARLTADGSTLVFSTYLGGSGGDEGLAVVVDPTAGDVFVTGFTLSTNFPTANPLQPNYGGGVTDAFVARMSADGSALVFSTYLGGSDDDRGFGIAVDPATGDVLVTGWTASTNFPTANPLQQNNAGTFDAFVARISF